MDLKITIAKWGNYDAAFKYLFEQGLDVSYVSSIPCTKKTLKIGAMHSPDYVCSPFKLTLGSMIEALDNGANAIAQVGGVCRLGYYGEAQEQILKDLGYDFFFFNMASMNFKKPMTVYNEFKKLNPNVNIKKVASALIIAFEMVKAIDNLEIFIRENVGFEINNGEMEKIFDLFLNELYSCDSKKMVKKVYNDYLEKLKNVKINKPDKLIKVGVVGEYYTVMEPFSNHFLEKELAKKGIVVDRWMNITNTIINNHTKDQKEYIKGYAKYNMGATSMSTISKSLEFAKNKYDGIVHIKSFGCTPEIDAMPVLQQISKDYKIPILYFSFDTQTSQTGIETRLEAFHDMILMRKENK